MTGTTNAGGLIGRARTSGQGITTVTDSYWDTESSGQSASAGGEGKTGAELRAPTDYSGIYANWNLDLDNADDDNSHATGQDDPWDFGAALQLPDGLSERGRQSAGTGSGAESDRGGGRRAGAGHMGRAQPARTAPSLTSCEVCPTTTATRRHGATGPPPPVRTLFRSLRRARP